jgi:hypothetical protein
MGRLETLSAYIRDFMASRPDGSAREAREWMEQTEVDAGTAAALANNGYTPGVVAAKMAEAYERGDERDADRVVDQMLHGPGLGEGK